MSFRLELAHGNGRPRYWEVLCDFCEVVAHFPCVDFDAFTDAAERARALGWDTERGARRLMYLCPQCAAAGRAGRERRGVRWRSGSS